MNSSSACPYDSCEFGDGSEFKTAIFECSRSGKRSTDLGFAPFAIFRRQAILAASLPQVQYRDFDRRQMTISPFRTNLSRVLCQQRFHFAAELWIAAEGFGQVSPRPPGSWSRAEWYIFSICCRRCGLVACSDKSLNEFISHPGRGVALRRRRSVGRSPGHSALCCPGNSAGVSTRKRLPSAMMSRF
jgi:hypothetical protein